MENKHLCSACDYNSGSKPLLSKKGAFDEMEKAVNNGDYKQLEN